MNVDFNLLTKTPHCQSQKGTFHDLEDSQFSTKATFRYNFSVKEEEKQYCENCPDTDTFRETTQGSEPNISALSCKNKTIKQQ